MAAWTLLAALALALAAILYVSIPDVLEKINTASWVLRIAVGGLWVFIAVQLLQSGNPAQQAAGFLVLTIATLAGLAYALEYYPDYVG